MIISQKQAEDILKGIAAIRRCGELYANNERIYRMAQAKAKLECARLLRRSYSGGMDRQQLSMLHREMKAGDRSVLCSEGMLRDKIKYYLTCLFTKAASHLLNSRENRLLD